MLYLLLASVAARVQWEKWQALHHMRNLVAMVVSTLALVIAATCLLRDLRAKDRTSS